MNKMVVFKISGRYAGITKGIFIGGVSAVLALLAFQYLTSAIVYTTPPYCTAQAYCPISIWDLFYLKQYANLPYILILFGLAALIGALINEYVLGS